MPTIRVTNSAGMRSAASTRIDDEGLERYVGDDGYDYEDKDHEDESWLITHPATVGGFKDWEALTGRPYATAKWSKADIATEKQLIKEAVGWTKERIRINKIHSVWYAKLYKKPNDEKLQATVLELEGRLENDTDYHREVLRDLFKFQSERVTNPRTRARLRGMSVDPQVDL